MIKLSDYLDYLNNEIIQARKLADENAVLVAKEYAKHEYLKYFRVPRFSMPTVKLEIPIKISDIDQESKYEFRMDEAAFIKEVNSNIKAVNHAKNIKLKGITKATLRTKEFKQILNKLTKVEVKSAKDIELITKKVVVVKANSPLVKTVGTKSTTNVDTALSRVGVSAGTTVKTKPTTRRTSQVAEHKELESIFRTALQNSYAITSTNLNEIFIDPNTTGQADENKIFVKLNVELVEEGFRILKARDQNGKDIEEIIFE